MTGNSAIKRRTLMATAAAAVLAAPRRSRAEGAPIKIGVLNDASSFTSDLSGVGAQVSAALAIEDFGPTVLGRPIELLKADHQAKGDLGVGFARQWYDDGVGAIFDVGITTVALGVQQLAREKNKIVMYTSTGTVDLTGKLCSPNSVHWTYDSYSVAVGTARANMPDKPKSWFFMTVDYAYGRSLEAEATKYILAHGGTVTGTAVHALATTDFASDLLKARASGAELIALATPTSLAGPIIKQASEFGFMGGPQKFAPIGLFYNDVKGLGLEIAQGLLIVEPYYWDQTDATRAFAKRYLAKMRKMPNGLQASVYGAVMHYLKAVQSAKTDQTEPVMKAMKATPVNDFMTQNGHIRPDGRLLRDEFVFRVKTPAESKNEWDLFAPVFTIPADQAFKAPDPAACPLAG